MSPALWSNPSAAETISFVRLNNTGLYALPHARTPEKQPEKPSPWTPEMVKSIIEGLRPFGERYMALQERRFQHELDLEKAISKEPFATAIPSGNRCQSGTPVMVTDSITRAAGS